MRGVVRLGVLVAAVVLVHAVAFAQSEIAGVARDASGAVIPGVTVEASSDALIEKVRSATTDGSGQDPNRGFAARFLHRDLHAVRVCHREAGRARADRSQVSR